MRHNIGLYLRVSTDEQAVRHEGSLDNQKHRLVSFVDIKNIQETGWGRIVETYIDDGVSAKNTKRDAFQSMMKDIRKGKINLILVTDLSRLSRNILDFCILLEDLKKANAKFLSMKEQFDTTTAAGEMMVFNMINLAQFERKQTSERVAMNFHARAMRGLRNGGYLLLGFDKDPANPSSLAINPHEAEDVKAIFQMYLDEASLYRTVARLNQSTICPKALKTEAFRHNENGKWTVQNLQGLLRNPIYIGKREVNRGHKDKNPEHLRTFERYQVVKAAWPAIMDEKTFNDVQLRLDENLTQARARLGNAESRVFLASGFLSCAECGRALVGATSHGAKQKHRYYIHRPIQGEPVTCSVKSIRADDLEESLLNQLDEVLLREGYLDEIAGRIEANSKAKQGEIMSELEANRRALEQVQKEVQAAFRLHADVGAAVVDDLFREQLVTLKDKKIRLEAKIREIESRIADEIQPAGAARNVIEMNLAEFREAKGGASRPLLKRILKKVIETIVVEPSRIGLRYWESNVKRDERQPRKAKKATDSLSVASIIKFPVQPSSDPRPLALAVGDHRVGCSYVIKDGRDGWIRTSDPLHPMQVR